MPFWASVRKDGLLLFAEPNTLSLLSPVQVLTSVYLAGVLFPCLATALSDRPQTVLQIHPDVDGEAGDTPTGVALRHRSMPFQTKNQEKRQRLSCSVI